MKPGQAGWVCLYTLSFLFGCCFFVFSFNLFMLVLPLCSSFGSLWGSILDPSGTFGGPFGLPGASLGSFVHTCWLLGYSEPQGPKCLQKVVSQPQRCHFRGRILAPFLYLFQKKRVRGECWLAGRFFCSFSWFSGSLDPPSAAACAVQSQFFMFGVTLENVSFLYTFWWHFGVIWAHLFMFLVFFSRA